MTTSYGLYSRRYETTGLRKSTRPELPHAGDVHPTDGSA
jgi:hypothetical protein